MRLSNYFLPTLKENPSDAHVVSHKLMLRSGMIRQITSGIYVWLPLGYKVLKNIETIVRKNMNQAGCIELLMPRIQSADIWHESGRYDAYGKEMLRFKDRHNNELLFGPTNEEVITDIFRHNIKSYKDLPKNFYHIQWKFRDEIRPRFGVLRAREFYMKDAYSFDLDYESARKSYNNMFTAYMNSFKELGLVAVPVRANTGAIGGDLSHEFHIVADTGESDLYYDKRFEVLSQDPNLDLEQLQSLYAVADEKHDPVNCPISKEQLSIRKGIEVGHIFYFGTKYSEAMNAYVTNKEGVNSLVEMGSYGIGISRLVGAVIEANHDEHGIIWPEMVAPFKASIINLKPSDPACDLLSERIYAAFCGAKIDVLYDDDTRSTAGSKFATHDLIGSPWQLVVSNKTATKDIIELKHRRTGERENLPAEIAIKKVLGNLNVK